MRDAALVEALVDRLLRGDPRALARAISLVENDAPEAAALLSACFPHTGWALRIGITGAPGAGKSTLVDRLARQYREAGRSVGVIGVDPTSPFTGGAILGDRIRVAGLHNDPGFYFRSMATRGSLGGLALTTADVALVVEASGKEILLIETVGVGQDEIEIARLADITLVVLVPGMGDDVQSLKAGVMEIADLFVINKSDREGADRVEQEIRALQSLAAQHAEWTPPIVRTIASNGTGTERLASAIAEMEEWLQGENRLAARRARHWQRRINAMLRTELMRRARRQGIDQAELDTLAERVASGQEDPWKRVAQITATLFAEEKERLGTGERRPKTMSQIDHLGIAVHSIAQARGLYEALGLSVVREETVEHEQVRTAMIPAGDARIELLEATSPDSPVGRFLAKRGEGLHHMAIQVEDISAALETLKARGARLVSEEIQIGAGGHLYFFVHPSSTGGVLLEICQDPPTE